MKPYRTKLQITQDPTVSLKGRYPSLIFYGSVGAYMNCQLSNRNIVLWMKNIACHISKQRMLQPPSHHIIATLMVSPEGTQDGEPAAKPSATAATTTGHHEGIRMERRRILAPGIWDAYERNDFSEPRLLHLPIHRKALNFINLRYMVFFN